MNEDVLAYIKANPNTNFTTDKIRRDGEIKALKNQIDVLQFKFIDVWENTSQNYTFCRFQQAINQAQFLLIQMQNLFDELKKLEPENK